MKKLIEQSARLKVLVVCLVIALSIMMGHGARIASNFSQVHWEDALFQQHVQERVHSFADCFTEHLWPGLYRPLTTSCYYWVMGRLTGGAIEFYHLVNLLFYALNGLLLFVLCQRLFAWPWTLAPIALFVSRCAHAEVVTNSVEFQVLISLFFLLLTLELMIRGASEGRIELQLLAGVMLILALFSKETAIVAPALLLLYAWLFHCPQLWRGVAALGAIVLVWAGLFVTLLRSLTAYAPTGFAYDFSPGALLFKYNVYLLGFANTLVAGEGNPVTSDLLLSTAGTPFALSCFTLLSLLTGALIVWSRQLNFWGADQLRTLLFGLGFFAIATAPFVLLQDRLFLRYSYGGHAGLAIAVAVILQSLVTFTLRQVRVRIEKRSLPPQPWQHS